MSAASLSQLAVYLRPEDNVAVAARHLAPGTKCRINGATFTLAQRIPLGHKLAVRPIRKGEAVYKYGQIIGFASADIAAGSHVHVHNVAADAFERDYGFCRDCPPPKAEPRFWMGYDRGGGRYGTRNYLAVISTVNCSASTSKYISERFRSTDLLRQYPNVDGVVAITHKVGCAMQYGGPDHLQLERTLDVSRPFVIKLIQRRELPCRMVGKHRRIPSAALLEYREKMYQRAKSAADEMAQTSQDLGLYEAEVPPSREP
jgi:altronate hydrolase